MKSIAFEPTLFSLTGPNSLIPVTLFLICDTRTGKRHDTTLFFQVLFQHFEKCWQLARLTNTPSTLRTSFYQLQITTSPQSYYAPLCRLSHPSTGNSTSALQLQKILQAVLNCKVNVSPFIPVKLIVAKKPTRLTHCRLRHSGHNGLRGVCTTLCHGVNLTLTLVSREHYLRSLNDSCLITVITEVIERCCSEVLQLKLTLCLQSSEICPSLLNVCGSLAQSAWIGQRHELALCQKNFIIDLKKK